MADDKSLMEPDIELTDDIDEPFDPEVGGDPDADDVEEDPLEDDAGEVGKVDEIEEKAQPKRPEKRADAGEGEFDDEVDPDNLEDDLNTILRDRIAAGDDADDDDAGEVNTGQPAEMLGAVTPRRDDEWLCEGCFLLVSRSQLGSRNNPRCPSGEEVCPSLDRLGP